MVAPAKPAIVNKRPWVPERQDVIWIDCIPQAGNEMLVLSPRSFNERTSLVIGLPMTTEEYNADNPFAVAVSATEKNNKEKISYVLCHQPKSFDWRNRKASPHALKRLSDKHFAECCACLNQILQLAL